MTDFGESIRLAEITLNKVKPSTANNYRQVLVKINKFLKVPDPHRLYYEYLGRDDIRQQILDNVASIFNIKTPSSYTAKISPVKHFMLSVPDLPSDISLVWLKRYKIPEFDPVQQNLEMDWEALLERFQTIISDETKDPRLRIICLLMSKGLVMRSGVFFSTRINQDDGESNYMDLDKGKWNIRDTKSSFAQVVSLDDDVLKQIKDIVDMDPVLFETMLIARNNGSKYIVSNIQNFAPWKKESLPGCNKIRQAFETHNWNSGKTALEASKCSMQIDHTPSTAANHYVKPTKKEVKVQVKVKDKATKKRPIVIKKKSSWV